MANACMKKNGGSITWTDANPSQTDCTGLKTSAVLHRALMRSMLCIKSGNYRIAFSVGIVSDIGGRDRFYNSQGIVRQVRTTSSDVVMQTNLVWQVRSIWVRVRLG